jgi:hypothetical protein
MLLTFSNYSSAGFFGDVFEVVFGKSIKTDDESIVNNVRCKVEYTQLDLNTGLEKKIKHTDQYATFDSPETDSILYVLTQDLADKINKWLNESKENIITDLTIINCKERRLYYRYSRLLYFFSTRERWSEYKGCPDEYNVKLIDFLDRPKQWGYNVHKERLIKDYEDGCKNYNSNWK